MFYTRTQDSLLLLISVRNGGAQTLNRLTIFSSYIVFHSRALTYYLCKTIINSPHISRRPIRTQRALSHLIHHIGNRHPFLQVHNNN